MRALSERLKQRKDELEIECSCRETIDTLAARAEEAGHPVHRSTVDKYLRGKGAKQPPEKTIQGLAAAFAVTAEEVRLRLKMPAGANGPWVPPEEAARLSREQRQALDRLIRTIVQKDRAVTEAQPEHISAGEHHESVAKSAPTGKNAETIPSRRRTAGPGARPQTKKAKHVPSNHSRDADV